MTDRGRSRPWTMPDPEFPHLADDEELSPFALRDARGIGQVLHGLAEARALVSVRLVPGGHACPTALLEVRDDGTLLLDGNRDEVMNRRMAEATRLVCSAQLDLVPIRFRLPTPTRTVHEDFVAFLAPWPQSLLRLQRRESYRLPMSATATATVEFDAAAGATPRQPLRALDLSGGGVALAVPGETVHGFQAGTRLPPCRLRLGDADPVPVAIEVAWLARDGVRGNVDWWRAGCRFVDLPPAVEQQVMQYIFRVERQRNARLRRGG